MDLKKVLGFSLKPVRVDPDGASAPPETSALSPPSHPALAKAKRPGSDAAPPAGPADPFGGSTGGREPATPPSVVATAQAMKQTRIEDLGAVDVLPADRPIRRAPPGTGATWQSATHEEADVGDETAIAESEPVGDDGDREEPSADAEAGASTDGDGAADEAPNESGAQEPSSEEGIARDLEPAAGVRGRLLALSRPWLGVALERADPLLRWCRLHRRVVVAGAASTTLATALGLSLWLAGAEPESSAETSTAAAATTPRDSTATEPEVTNAEGATTDEAAPDAWDSVPEVSPQACARLQSPQRLRRDVSPSFALEAQALPGSVEVLVGAAVGDTRALGLRVNATTLRSSDVVDESLPRALLGVVPQVQSDDPGFVVDRAGVGGLRSWRTLPGARKLALSRTNRGLHLVRRAATHRSVSLWPLGTDEVISRPAIAWQNADRFAAAFRRGGRRGSIVVGWVDRRTLRRSELRELPLTGGQVGKPALAIHRKRALVAAAVRDDAGATWRLELVTTQWTGRTRRLSPSPIAGRDGVSAFAPRIASLADGRWVLQWTEGKAGERTVQGVTLDPDLTPLAEPVPLSAPGANAGGGLLVPVDAGLLSLFLVQSGSRYDLWGTTLACD